MAASPDSQGAASLNAFGPDIWVADGPTVTAAAGFHYPTRAVIIRLSGGRLFLWSPVELTEKLRTEIGALGDVRYLIAPNSLHHIFLAEWKNAYPAAGIYAAPGLREKYEQLSFDGDLGDIPPEEWSRDLDQVLVHTVITDEVVFFHRKSGTAIFTDLLQNFPADWFSGWRAVVAKWDLMLGHEPSVPRKFRFAFANRRRAREALGRILAWPVEKVLMAHGKPVTEHGQAYLKRAFAWLMR